MSYTKVSSNHIPILSGNKFRSLVISFPNVTMGQNK